jgi:asparagine synthase (glutamine-hydrolysing)
METIAHRGPDGQGTYYDSGLALGHLRLSIIDLNTGDQPICNEDRSIWIVYNGEVYNFEELRRGLIAQGHSFRSSTDTEVIVHLYEEYGEDCLARLTGMFAFALWDSRKRKLFLARDRVGIKPLYYCDTGSSLLFASEIKSLLVCPDVSREISLAGIHSFLRHYYLPGSGTLFKNIARLDPGTFLVVENGQITRGQYWDLEFPDIVTPPSFEESAAALRDLLWDVNKGHMISDVPVGMLLSGGLDSTALLSQAVQQTSKEIQTFTIGFSGEGFADERPFAKLAARRFGTRHHEISITAEDFRDFLPSYVWHLEDPVCEPPAVALHYVSRLARDHVKVLLSGEGGDEAFGGYPNYRNLMLFENMKQRLGPLAAPVAFMLTWAQRFPQLTRFAKYAPLMGQEFPAYYYSRTSSPNTFFNRLSDQLCSKEFLKHVEKDGGASPIDGLLQKVKNKDLLSQMLYVDTKTWLPDDLLLKADKITMGNSLELRVPLLDHRVLEFAARLPYYFKVQGLATKRILKSAFATMVPDEIVNRKKTGFPVPYDRWLRGELRGYVRDMLLSPSFLGRGYFNKQMIESGLSDNGAMPLPAKETFSLLVLALWHERFSGKLAG